MSYNKEALRVRRATDARVIAKQVEVFSRYGDSVNAPGRYRKQKALACSCRMCRRMDYYDNCARHKTPAMVKEADRASASLQELD